MDDSDRIFQKLDSIDQALAEISVTMAVNTQSLSEHMRRTAILEEKVDSLQEDVIRVNVIGKIFAWCLGIIGSSITFYYKVWK